MKTLQTNYWSVLIYNILTKLRLSKLDTLQLLTYITNNNNKKQALIK